MATTWTEQNKSETDPTWKTKLRRGHDFTWEDLDEFTWADLIDETWDSLKGITWTNASKN